MANTLLTVGGITREAVRLFKNMNPFLQNINTQFDSSFGVAGAKIGNTLRIRLPSDYVVRTGPAASVQDTTQQSIQLVMATQKGVDFSFTSVEQALSLDNFNKLVLAPAMNNLTADIASDVMSGVEGGVSNIVFNADGSGNVISPTADQYNLARAALMNNSANSIDLKVVNGPNSDARVVNSLRGLFNPVPNISEQYRSGSMREALNFRWFADNNVILHTTGTFSAGTVSGASQTGASLVMNAITGTLKKGDIITIAGVNAVNRVNKHDLGELRQFVVTADVASGGTAIPIYPAIIPSNAGAAVQFQTVVNSPANGAAVALVMPASSVYRKNFAFAPEMVTMATADLPLDLPGAKTARANYDGISLRIADGYQIGTDQKITRLDILYGYVFVRPEWGVIVADVA